MTVLSLFNGMSCGQIALRELKIPVKNYYASEIDKFAIEQTQLNFPETIQLGDVTKWQEWNIDWASIGLILAGSPCQGFSFAGKQLAFNDPRSVLFFVFTDILNYIRKFNPDVKFLLENVNMKKSYMAVISQYCGLFPVNINSNLVSAQNRDRWYWSNIRTKQVGLFGEVYTDILQPADRSLLLKDILEDVVDKKYYLSDEVIARLLKESPSFNPDKAHCVGVKNNTPLGSWARTAMLLKIKMDGKISPNQSKASCLTGAGGHGAGNHSDMDLIMQLPRGKNNGGLHKEKSPTLSANAWEQNNVLCVAMRGRYSAENQAEQCLEPNPTGKTNCLTSVAKDNLILQLNPSTESGGKQPYQQNRVYDPKGKSPALMAQLSCGSNAILDGYRIRRLTPTECSRLQTIPTWYKWACSDTQIYRMCGNGWTVEVIKHILKDLV